MFSKAVPLLPAKDIRASVDFYESRLGFRALKFGNYAVLNFKNAEIHLYMITDAALMLPATCLILVDDIEDVYTQFSTRGLLQKNSAIKDSRLGMREFTITDNNHNLLRFAQKK